MPKINVEQREEIRSKVEEELNIRLDSEGRSLDESDKSLVKREEQYHEMQ